jgi:hypothetical protein
VEADQKKLGRERAKSDIPEPERDDLPEDEEHGPLFWMIALGMQRDLLRLFPSHAAVRMGHAGIRIGWRAAEGEGEMMLRFPN